MIKCGSLVYTLEKLEELFHECVDIIVGLGGHDDLQQLLQTLHDQVNEAHSISSPSSDGVRKKLETVAAGAVGSVGSVGLVAAAEAAEAEAAEAAEAAVAAEVAAKEKSLKKKNILSELNAKDCVPSVLPSVGIRVEEVGSPPMVGEYTTTGQSDAVLPQRSTSGSFDTL